MFLKNTWATQFPLIKNLQITSINIYPYQIKKLDNSLQIDAYIETANSFQWFFFLTFRNWKFSAFVALLLIINLKLTLNFIFKGRF